MNRAQTGSDVNTCLLVSLVHNDSGYPAAEAWLARSEGHELWISHWVLLEFAFFTALPQRRGELESGRIQVLQEALEQFRTQRLGMLEPRGDDFLLARSWLENPKGQALRAGDALHLALAYRPHSPW